MRLLLAFLLLVVRAFADPISSHAGCFAADTATGPQVVSAPFAGKAFVFFPAKALTAAGSQADAFMGIGFSDDQATASDSTAGSAISVNGGTTATRNISGGSPRPSIFVVNSAGTGIAQAYVSATSATDFTLEWTVVDGVARQICYWMFGGSGISDVAANNATVAGTGNYNVTTWLTGTTPKLVLWSFIGGPPTFNWMLGAATATDQWCLQGLSINGANPSNTSHTQDTGKFTCLDTTIQGTFVSMNVNGFTGNMSVNPFTLAFDYLAIAATGDFKIGEFSQATSTGEQSVAGVGFTPGFLAQFGTGATGTDTAVDPNRLAVGAATSSTARWSMAIHDQDNVNPFNASTLLATDKLQTFITANGATPTIQTQADFVCFSGDGWTQDNTTVDATARQIFYLAAEGDTNTCTTGFVRHRVTQE